MARNPQKTIAPKSDELAFIEQVWSQMAESQRRGPDRRSPSQTLNKDLVRLAVERARQLALQYNLKITVSPKD